MVSLDRRGGTEREGNEKCQRSAAHRCSSSKFATAAAARMIR
jgi:hypothetical protein